MKKPVVFLLCVVIIGGAIFLGKILIESKPKPKPNEIVEQHPFVETVQANLVSPKASVESIWSCTSTHSNKSNRRGSWNDQRGGTVWRRE